MKIYIVGIIIICLLLLISEINYFLIDKNKFNIKSVADIKFRTGDLIFSKAHNGSILTHDSINKNNTFYFKNIFMSKRQLMRLLIGFYTHVAVIICINDIPYVYELNEYIDRENRYCNYFKKIREVRSPVLLDINYLERYEGHCYHHKYKGRTIQQPEKFIELYSHKKLIYGSKYIEAYNAYKENHDFLNTIYLTCCTIVSDFLKINNIIDKNYNSIFSTPRSLLKAAVCNTNNYEKKPTLIKNYYSVYKQ